MKFHLIQSDNKNLITGYDLNWVEINQVRYQSSLIVTPDQLLLEWPVKTIAGIKENSFEAVESLNVEIIFSYALSKKLSSIDPNYRFI
jgi:uncharacterized protein